MRVLRGFAAGVAVMFPLVTSCVYDAEDRCDENQILWEGKRCICVEGAVLTDAGCKMCGANERPVAESCECVQGYSRPTPEAACEPVPAALGAACDTASTPCSDAVYAHCQVVSGTTGYCTNTGCTATSGCIGGYACDTSTAAPYCRRPPVGQGAACDTTQDCAAYEATFCESFQTHQCLVEGCSTTADTCFVGYECCDLTSLGLNNTLCVPAGACPT